MILWLHLTQRKGFLIKEIDLVINTPTKGNDSKRDGFLIRRAAVERNIGVITALDTLRAIADVKVEEIENNNLEVFNMAEQKKSGR